MTDVTKLTWEEASDELDGIVSFLESSEVDVDQLVGRLQRASELVEELDRRLIATRSQVDELLPKLERAAERVDPDTGEVLED
jgi:exodeoxyribonuclease VII small subunit